MTKGRLSPGGPSSYEADLTISLRVRDLGLELVDVVLERLDVARLGRARSEQALDAVVEPVNRCPKVGELHVDALRRLGLLSGLRLFLVRLELLRALDLRRGCPELLLELCLGRVGDVLIALIAVLR